MFYWRCLASCINTYSNLWLSFSFSGKFKASWVSIKVLIQYQVSGDRGKMDVSAPTETSLDIAGFTFWLKSWTQLIKVDLHKKCGTNEKVRWDIGLGANLELVFHNSYKKLPHIILLNCFSFRNKQNVALWDWVGWMGCITGWGEVQSTLQCWKLDWKGDKILKEPWVEVDCADMKICINESWWKLFNIWSNFK